MANKEEKRCVICLSLFKYCSENGTESPNVKNISEMYKVFLKYLNSEPGVNSAFELQQGDLRTNKIPFCEDCKTGGQSLLQMHTDLTKIEKDIAKLVSDLRVKIQKNQNQSLSEGDDDEDLDEEDFYDILPVKTEIKTEDLEDSDCNEFLDEIEVDVLPFANSPDEVESYDEEIQNISDISSGIMDPFLESNSCENEEDSVTSETPARCKREEDTKRRLRSNSHSESSGMYNLRDRTKTASKRKLKASIKEPKEEKVSKKSAEIACETCGQNFTSIRSLQDHSKMHRGVTWECDICNETFYYSLMPKTKHIKMRHPEEAKINMQLQCKACKERFPTKYLLEIHTLSHTGEIPFTCQTCQKCFSNISDYVHHLKFSSCASNGVSDPNVVFTCSTCQETFKMKYLLWSHELEHNKSHKARDFLCKVCNKTFPKKFQAEKHFISHTEEKPFPCDICGKRMSHISSLTFHRQSHITPESLHKCSICYMKFVTQDILDRHFTGHSVPVGFFCELCGKSFTKRSALRRHKSTVHNIRKIVQSNPHSCNTSKIEIKTDTLVKTGRRTSSKNTLKSESPQSNPIMHCHQCDLNFTCRMKYTYHRKRHLRYWAKNSPYGEKPPFICVKCKTKFEEKDLLKQHYSIFEACKNAFTRKTKKTYKFKCKTCDYRAKNIHNLQEHVRTHTGEKPFTCETCGTSFARRNKMKEHMLRNAGNCNESKYTCKFCSAACASMQEMKEHYIANPECKTKLDLTKKYPCDVCGKRIESYKRLLVHMKSHH